MKNIINYYYNLHPKKILLNGKKYFFEYNESKYVLEPINRPLGDLRELYNLNKKMISKNFLVHEIILNNENEIITYINNKAYILMEFYVNENVKIKLSDVYFVNNNTIDIENGNSLIRNDWVLLWELKNDYFESQINEIGKKYKNLCNYANYYMGLSENAISYVKKASLINEPALYSVCHKRIGIENNLYDLYNPLDFIIDYRIRDIAEYIKSSFFKGDDAFLILEEYFKYNYISYKEALLFYGRLLYPSYFFDLYDDIINGNLNEKLIDNIVLKSNDYENFLYDVNVFFSNLFNRYFPSLDWIIKRSI